MSVAERRPIALVSMPTLAAHHPSFQLALLKPTLERAGFAVEPVSLFLPFAQAVGWRLNDALAQVTPCLAGEWVWTRAAFGDFRPARDYLARFEDELRLVARRGGAALKDLRALQAKGAPAFLDWALTSRDWSRYAFVGFTVVFQQLVATLAMARRLKERHPGLPIVLGGATFEDDIAAEVLARCPWVDVVHCGDADLTLPELARRLEQRQPLDGLPGVMHRGPDGQVRYAGRAPNLEQLERTPTPDFDEYFQEAGALGFFEHDQAHEVMLPIETARGCWYGMKNHCTFCGLNRAGMAFRSKPPAQVLEMLRDLSRRYGVKHFNAIDNILAPEYADALFGALAQGRSDLRLHYEIRPTVSHAQLRAMHLGGLVSVQPGVESFSTRVLSLMKKHTTGMRNVELLKWSTYYGIDNLYNVLHGFRGETARDYAEQARVMRRIAHLQPPYAFARARADRGSPMFERGEELGVTKLRPAGCYPYLFPKSFDLRRISYFFEDDRRGVPKAPAYRTCEAVVRQWRERWEREPRPQLTYTKTWDSLSVLDTRGKAPRTVRLDDREARLYEACADARRREDLVAALDGDAAFVDGALARLEAQDLVLHLDDRWLALALPANPHH